MELTQRVLNRLRGRLDIVVCHPQIAGELIVRGATNNAADYGWDNMPPEMKVDRSVYCCQPVWDATSTVFVFADEVTVVDAPADMVIDEMLDMLCEAGLDEAVNRLEDLDEVWHGEEE